MISDTEQQVFDFFGAIGTSVARIPVGSQRTPDLLVVVNGVEVVIEVKSISENPKERAALRQIAEGHCLMVDHSDQRARFSAKIKDANIQLRNRCAGRPGVVVIEDCRSFFTRSISPQFSLLEAMFGEQVFWLTQPNVASNHEPRMIAHDFGRGRTLGAQANTTTSAVALFRSSTLGNRELLIHHNPFALNPLPFRLFDSDAVREFQVDPRGESSEFEEIL